MKTILILALAGLVLAGCDEQPKSADQKEREATAQLTAEASSRLGMPAIHNFQEKKSLKMLYEMRDNPNLRTYSYIVDMSGSLHKFCDSTGFGIPYATQYSNPQKVDWHQNGNLALPQSEPNGLFMPASADGTWLMCLDPRDQKVKPVYVEPHVVVSPFPMVPEEAKK